eukprot:scaffold18449_cov49-Attheya_sp.AAC.2
MALSKATAKAEATARAHLEAMLSLTHQQQQSYWYQNNHDTNIEPLPNNAVVPNRDEKTKGESPHDLDTTLITAPIQTTDSHKHSEDSSSSFHGLKERSLQTMGFPSSYANALSSLLPSTRQFELLLESSNDKNGNGYSYLETLSHHQQKKPPPHLNTSSEFQSVKDETDEPLVSPLSPSLMLQENPPVEHHQHAVPLSHGEEEEASFVVSSVQKTMTTGPFGYLDSLAMSPTVSCGEAMLSQGHSLESPSVAKSSPPLVSHHEPVRFIDTKDDHDKEMRNGILSEPMSRSVEQYPVSAVSVVAESRTGNSALSSFVSLEGTETRRANNLVKKESVQKPATTKVATTMVESSNDLSSFSHLNSLHRASSQIMTANHASPPKGYLDSLEVVSSLLSSTSASWKCRLLFKAWMRVMIQYGAVLRRNNKEDGSMTLIRTRARKGVVWVNQVATRLEQTVFQKEERAKATLQHLGIMQQVVAMEQQTVPREKNERRHSMVPRRGPTST